MPLHYDYAICLDIKGYKCKEIMYICLRLVKWYRKATSLTFVNDKQEQNVKDRGTLFPNTDQMTCHRYYMMFQQWVKVLYVKKDAYCCYMKFRTLFFVS
jgi:hypothetical protein